MPGACPVPVLVAVFVLNFKTAPFNKWPPSESLNLKGEPNETRKSQPSPVPRASETCAAIAEPSLAVPLEVNVVATLLISDLPKLKFGAAAIESPLAPPVKLTVASVVPFNTGSLAAKIFEAVIPNIILILKIAKIYLIILFPPQLYEYHSYFIRYDIH